MRRNFFKNVLCGENKRKLKEKKKNPYSYVVVDITAQFIRTMSLKQQTPPFSFFSQSI